MPTAPEHYDALIIGAGIGGLIAAAQLAQAGQRVLVVENMSFVGGRFSAFPVAGVEFASGAFHTLPHGGAGPAAQALRRAGVQMSIPSAKVIASFHVNGQHVVARTGFEVFKILPGIRDKWKMCDVLLRSWRGGSYDGSYGQWLIEQDASERVRAIFDRFCQFALSVTVYDIPFDEGREVIRAVLKYGLPGVPVGGARAVANGLHRAALRAGVTVRKNTHVDALLTQDGRVCGARLRDRRRDVVSEVRADVIISNAGPGSTHDMLRETGLNHHTLADDISPPPAVGLKVQVSSAKSLIDHDSIMFCLDTQRIAGILQVTNVDPNLSRDGRHLLISHQTIAPGADWQHERDLALEDWRYLFGDDFVDCEVVGVSHFPARFPVNWAQQGHDVRTQPFADVGVWLVGDGVKPPGLMMVEGVAASAEQVAAQILGHANVTPWEKSFTQWARALPGVLWRWARQ